MRYTKIEILLLVFYIVAPICFGVYAVMKIESHFKHRQQQLQQQNCPAIQEPEQQKSTYDKNSI